MTQSKQKQNVDMAGWGPAMQQAQSTALPGALNQFNTTQNSPLWRGAQDWASRTMAPEFADPRNNPYFAGAMDDTLGRIRGQATSLFSRAGRGNSNSASGVGGYFTDTATRAAMPALAGMYQQNLGMQQQAAGMAPGLVADPAYQQYLSNIAGLAGLGQKGTTTTTATPSPLQIIAGLGSMGLGAFSAPAGGTSAAAGIASMFSDRRLKADVERIADDPRGFGIYAYRYLWDAPGVRRVGVMADEVAPIVPEAIGVHPAGWLMVDYGAL